MLSDAIRNAKSEVERYRPGGVALDGFTVEAAAGILDVWAAEAANMEARLEELSGRPHAPLAPPARPAALRVVSGAE